MSRKPTKPAIDTVEVTLGKEHTHQGKKKQPGDKIRVARPIAEWLKAQGVLTKPTTEQETSA